MTRLSRTPWQWLLALCLCLSMGALRAQTLQPPDWQQSQPGSTGVSLTLDPTGNAYALGLTSPSPYDAAVGAVVLSRYTATGALQWTRSWFPTGYAGARPRAVLSDAAGSAFVIGAYSDYNYVTRLLEDGTPSTTIAGLFDGGWAVQKFGPDGTLLWTRKILRIGGGALSGAVDASGHLYLLSGVSGNRALHVDKLSGSDGSSLWTASVTAATGGEVPGELRLTPDGQVVAASAGGLGLALYAFASDTGVLRWNTRLADAAGLYAPALAVGPLGELVVGGSSTAGALYLASIDANRLLTFGRSIAAGSRALRVAVDGLGRIYVAGVGAQPTNWLTLVVDAAGRPLAGPSVLDRHATSNEAPRALVLHAGGAFTVTGAAGPGSATDPAATRATTLRQNADGSIAWLASAEGASAGVALVAAADASVMVLGDRAQTLLHYPALVPVTPQSLTLAKSTLTGGRSTTGTVNLSSKAGAVVRLTSSHPGLVSVPASVTVPSGASAASFSVGTARVRTQTAVTLTATANGRSVTTVLTLKR